MRAAVLDTSKRRKQVCCSIAPDPVTCASSLYCGHVQDAFLKRPTLLLALIRHSLGTGRGR